MLLGVLGTNEILILFLLAAIIFLIIKYGKNLKKFFGILFLIIGLIGVGFGIGNLVEVSSKNDTFEGRLKDRFNEYYRTENDQQQMAGIVLIAGGAVFFIFGIIMLASKSNAQIKKEAELEVLKSMQTYQNQRQQKIEAPTTNASHMSINDTYAQLERLGKLKEQGILSDEEFQQQKKKLLG